MLEWRQYREGLAGDMSYWVICGIPLPHCLVNQQQWLNL
jgi:hypothetical protein